MTEIKLIWNGKIDISEFVKYVSLSGDDTKFNHVLNVELQASTDGRTPKITFEEGDALRFYVDGSTRFMGVIFSQHMTSDGSLSITAYDSNIYLAKSNDSRTFINKKASEIVQILAREFGIKVGTVADTGYVIPILKVDDIPLADIIKKALLLTKYQTGKSYFIGMNQHWLTLTEGKSNERYIFRDGDNLISAVYMRSIEDVKTQVKVIGGAKSKETVVTVKDDAKRAKYGVLQTVEKLDESATASQIRQRANELLKAQSVVTEELTVEALGVKEVDVGTPVYVQNAMTKTAGAYFVTAITHTYEGGLHTMTMQLSRTYELPEITVSNEEVGKK